MATFDFVLIGSHSPQRVEVPAESLAKLADDIAGGRFTQGEMPPDDWGEIRRVLIPTCRIQMVVESA